MDLMGYREAAQVLGISADTIRVYVRDGLLRSYGGSRIIQLDPNEVYKLRELREAKLTFVEVAFQAAKAEMTAYRLERQVSQLLSIIGADIPSASLEPEAVRALHVRVEETLNQRVLADINEVMFWAQTFQSLSEEFFHVVAEEMVTNTPWKKYLELSNKLLRGMSSANLQNDLELRTAYNYLEMARRSMRQAMFFYVRTTSGKKIANRLFPEALGDVHEDVLTMVSLIAD